MTILGKALGTLAIVIAIGIAVGVAISLALFHSELEPFVMVKPRIDLVYLYLRIDRVSTSTNNSLGGSLYAISYIAVVEVRNNSSYTLVPLSIDLVMLGNSSGPSIAIEKVGVKEGARGVATIARRSSARLTPVGVDVFWIPRHYVPCWILPNSGEYYILRTVKLVPESSAKWLVEAAEKGLRIAIRFSASLQGAKGGGEASIVKLVKLTKLSDSEYLYNALPKNFNFLALSLGTELCELAPSGS